MIMSRSFVPLFMWVSVWLYSTTASGGVAAFSVRDTNNNNNNDRNLYQQQQQQQQQILSQPVVRELQQQDRRDFLFTAGSGLLMGVGTVAWTFAPAAADAAAAVSWGSSPEHPIAVLGANGRTGREVVQTLAKEGLYSVCWTRQGVDPFRVVKLPVSQKQFIANYDQPVDVKSLASLQQAMAASKASALIYCASASKQGGTAQEVDDVGVGYAAEAASANQARLVVISALAVDRPDSKSFKMTNTIGGNYNGIMDAKRQGEDKVRQTLAKTKDYVIVRPGVLMNGNGKDGPAGMELNQGDTIGGGLSRLELAQVTVGALTSGKRGVTVEAYRKATATKLQPVFEMPSGRELYSNTYGGLFDKVLSDEGSFSYLPK